MKTERDKEGAKPMIWNDPLFRESEGAEGSDQTFARF
jgi:hypothetical protein